MIFFAEKNNAMSSTIKDRFIQHKTGERLLYVNIVLIQFLSLTHISFIPKDTALILFMSLLLNHINITYCMVMQTHSYVYLFLSVIGPGWLNERGSWIA
jgi:hypothetical protein